MNKHFSKKIKFLLALLLLFSSSVPSALGSSQLESNGDLTSGSYQLESEDTIDAAANTNSTHPILSDLAVRQAIAYCTDRHALAQAAYPDLTEPEIDALMMDSFLVKTHWAYTSPTTQYPYDPDQGRVLLDAAGWTVPEGEYYRENAAGDLLVFKLSTTQVDFRYAWAEEFEQQMGGCGIWVERFHVDPPWLFGDKTGLFRRDFELIGYTNTANADEPDVIQHFGCDQIPSAQNNWQGDNYNGWCNQIASQAAEMASDTQLSQAARLPYFATLQNEYANDMPSLPLFMREEGGSLERIDFNFDTSPPPHPALNELNVRQAIAYCTDRRALAQAAYPELTGPEIDALMIDSFITKEHWAYTSPTSQYPYDPDQGKAMLDSAGWTVPDGEVYRENEAGDLLVFKLTSTKSDSRYALAQELKDQMGGCGIWVERFHVDPSWLFGGETGIFHRDFELGGWTNLANEEIDPGLANRFGCDYIPSAENGWQGNNVVGWCNEVASQAAEVAANTEISQTLRLAAFATLQNEFANDMPSLPLFVRSGSAAIEFVEFNMVPVDTSTSAVITPEAGGTLTSTVNLTTTLSFPSGAVSEPVTVTHELTDTYPVSSGFQFIGQNFSIQAVTADRTPVTSFTEPFTITIQYNDDDIQWVNEESLVLNYWNTETGYWEEIPITLDVVSNTITAVLDHLTDFAVIGESLSLIFLPTLFQN